MVWPGLAAATICNPLIPNPIKLNEAAAAAACSSTDEAREKKEAKSPLCIHDLLRFRSYPFYDTFANWPQPACPHLILSHLHIYEYHNITRSIPPLRRLSVKANDKTNLDLRFIFSAFSVLRQSRSRKKRDDFLVKKISVFPPTFPFLGFDAVALRPRRLSIPSFLPKTISFFFFAERDLLRLNSWRKEKIVVGPG